MIIIFENREKGLNFVVNIRVIFEGMCLGEAGTALYWKIEDNLLYSICCTALIPVELIHLNNSNHSPILDQFFIKKI